MEEEMRLKFNKEKLGLYFTVFALVVIMSIGGYSFYLEQQYNECVIKHNELLNQINNPKVYMPPENGGDYYDFFREES